MHLLRALRLEVLGSRTRSLPTLYASFANLQESLKGLMMAWKPHTLSRLDPLYAPGMKRNVSDRSLSKTAELLAGGWLIVTPVPQALGTLGRCSSPAEETQSCAEPL